MEMNVEAIGYKSRLMVIAIASMEMIVEAI
jgi:hypothetical protein